MSKFPGVLSQHGHPGAVSEAAVDIFGRMFPHDPSEYNHCAWDKQIAAKHK